MEIHNKGAQIVLDVNTDDQMNAYELMCVCGHKLSEHASPIFWYYPDQLHHTIHTRQCTHWDKNIPNKFCCEQFQLS
jgi:hypothetical protein